MGDPVWHDKLISAAQAADKVRGTRMSLEIGSMIVGAIDPEHPDDPPPTLDALQVVCVEEDTTELGYCAHVILNIIPGVNVFTFDDLLARMLMHRVNYHQEVLNNG